MDDNRKKALAAALGQIEKQFGEGAIMPLGTANDFARGCDLPVDDLAAWRMFDQAARTLRPGGELLVVGNRHLGYHVKLAATTAEIGQVPVHTGCC